MSELQTETDLQKNGIELGVDIDDITTRLAEIIHPWVIEQFNLTPPIDPFTTYSFPDGWGCSFEDSIAYTMAFYHSDAYMNITPIEGAVEAITSLARNHPIYAITSRPIEVQPQTLALLAKYFPPGTFAGVYFTGQFLGEKGQSETKLDVCKRLGVKVMVEDSLAYVRQIAPNGVAVALMDKPWNQTDDLPQNAVRLSTWEQIHEWILEYEQKLQNI